MGALPLITAILQLFPMAFSTYAQIRGDLSTQNQQALDALVDAAKAAALGSVAKADSDLEKASHT